MKTTINRIISMIVHKLKLQIYSGMVLSNEYMHFVPNPIWLKREKLVFTNQSMKYLRNETKDRMMGKEMLGSLFTTYREKSKISSLRRLLRPSPNLIQIKFGWKSIYYNQKALVELKYHIFLPRCSKMLKVKTEQ